MAFHEPVEVGFLPVRPLLEHLVELGQHVLHPGHVLGRHVLHGARDLVDEALHELFAQLVHQGLELLPGLRGRELVRLEGLDLAGQVGRQEIQVHGALLDDLLGDLLASLVAGLGGLAGHLGQRGPLLFDDLSEGVGDLVVDAAQVVVLEHLPTPLAELLHGLPQARQVLAVGGVEARLQHAAQGGVEVTVVQQVVGDLGHHLVGPELEALLGAVPA